MASLINKYSIARGPYTVTLPNASKIRDLNLQEISVTGKLIKKQLTTIDPQTGNRSRRYPASPKYAIESDGDLHFCLGTMTKKPHIPCEIQRANGMQDVFNNSIGSSIKVTGFFRCLFEHPGYYGGADAHICEIHPVRSVTIDGEDYVFDVGRPEDPSIHQWDETTQQDEKIEVTYDDSTDTLEFKKMGRLDINYVEVSGKVSNIKINSNQDDLSSFSFDSDVIGKTIEVFCLQNTRAATQLQDLKNNSTVTLLGLRNIDLDAAIKDQQYVINLLAVDINQ